MTRLLARAFFACILFGGMLSLWGCQPAEEQTNDGKILIVTTTGMIADAVKNIVGEEAEVVALMGPGVDPHLYKATSGDLSRLTKANIIFYNGLHLEGKMGEVMEKLGRQKPVVAVSEGIDHTRLRKAAEFGDSHDPHVWFDVEMWGQAVAYMGDTLAKFMPAKAENIRSNTTDYLTQITDLHAWVIEQMNQIPESQRVLITAHDAFGYFGKAYGVEVQGLQGISTLSEFGLQDITQLVDFIMERKIKAIFVETSVSQKAIDAVIIGCRDQDYQVQKGGTLYSDAMDEEGTEAGTYLGMVRSNVNTIVNALK